MTLERIMDEISPLWGVCHFDSIKDGLIDCRAKSRLPQNSKSVIVALADLVTEMARIGEEIGLSIRVQREDIFQAMHRI